MTTQLSEAQVQELRSHVQELLDAECRRRNVGFMLKIVEEFFQEGEILSFIVVPDREGVRAWDYADVLSKVEIKLRREEHRDLLLVPALPD